MHCFLFLKSIHGQLFEILNLILANEVLPIVSSDDEK